jgi:hypothetical protein
VSPMSGRTERSYDRREQGAVSVWRDMMAEGFSQLFQDLVLHWMRARPVVKADPRPPPRSPRRCRAQPRQRHRAARARLSALRPVHRPHCLDQHRMAGHRLEALDVDGHAIGRFKVRHRRGGHVRFPQPLGEVAGDDLRDGVIERRGPAIELVDVYTVGRGLDHELRPIDRGEGPRPDRP